MKSYQRAAEENKANKIFIDVLEIAQEKNDLTVYYNYCNTRNISLKKNTYNRLNFEVILKLVFCVDKIKIRFEVKYIKFQRKFSKHYYFQLLFYITVAYLLCFFF